MKKVSKWGKHEVLDKKLWFNVKHHSYPYLLLTAGTLDCWCSCTTGLSITIYSSMFFLFLLLSVRFQLSCFFYLQHSNLLTRLCHFIFPHTSRESHSSNASESSGTTETWRSYATFMHGGWRTALIRWVKWHLGHGNASFPTRSITLIHFSIFWKQNRTVIKWCNMFIQGIRWSEDEEAGVTSMSYEMH